jgi:hypothetical protein
MKATSRISLAFLLAVATFGTSVWALADAPKADRQCGGEHGGKGKGKGAMFQKADKNSDGFLTKDEVGAERWERIKVADANKDGKVTKAEMQQARKDGKLPRGKGKPSQKA